MLRKASLPKPFQALEVVNVGVVGRLSKKGSLPVNRGAVGNIALAKYTGVGLYQML